MATTAKCRRHPDIEPLEDYHTGDVVCPKCGLVLDKIIDNGPEWRTFDDDNVEKSRVGAAEDANLSSAWNLSTRIARADGGANSFSQSIRQQYKRRSVDNLCVMAKRKIKDISDRLHLPDVVINRAYNLYCRLVEKKHLKGNVFTMDVKTAACIYWACRAEKCSRTAEEICSVTEFSSFDIRSSIVNVQSLLKLIDERASVSEYVERFCTHLQCIKKVKVAAIKLAAKFDQDYSDVHTMPESLAAAVICAVSNIIGDEALTPHHVCAQLALNKRSVAAGRLHVQHLLKSLAK